MTYRARWQAYLLQDFPTNMRLARGLQRSFAQGLAVNGKVVSARSGGAAGAGVRQKLTPLSGWE